MPTPTTSITPNQLAAYGVSGLVTCALVGYFAWALPDALSRGREGVRRTREAPCQVLRPTAQNAVLGRLPQPAPDFALKTHDGQEVKLSSLRGRVVLVNFWATWCPTCVVEEPSLERLATQMKNKPFSLLAVSVDENWDLVRQHFPKGSAMTVLLDKDKKVPQAYGTEKFPESFLIDREGNIRYFVVSERQLWHTQEVRSCIDALIEE
ncbi:MAG: TlpA disulfide reductase family protein [Polyangia bacterium]|jgi:peroxiredoxin